MSIPAHTLPMVGVSGHGPSFLRKGVDDDRGMIGGVGAGGVVVPAGLLIILRVCLITVLPLAHGAFFPRLAPAPAAIALAHGGCIAPIWYAHSESMATNAK